MDKLRSSHPNGELVNRGSTVSGVGNNAKTTQLPHHQTNAKANKLLIPLSSKLTLRTNFKTRHYPDLPLQSRDGRTGFGHLSEQRKGFHVPQLERSLSLVDDDKVLLQIRHANHLDRSLFRHCGCWKFFVRISKEL